MINIALYQPRIPGNTGSIIRFCANTGIKLHLIHPMAFTWDDKKLRRAGLDYAEFAEIKHHESWQEFIETSTDKRCFIITTKGQTSVQKVQFLADDYLIFGAEDFGIASEHMADINQANWLRIPMKPNSRSMNLSNTVAIMGFEALRQLDFVGLG